VFWDKKTRRWRCQLGYQSRKIFLGYFEDAAAAARAYDRRLVELRGAAGAFSVPGVLFRARPPAVGRLLRRRSFSLSVSSFSLSVSSSTATNPHLPPPPRKPIPSEHPTTQT